MLSRGFFSGLRLSPLRRAGLYEDSLAGLRNRAPALPYGRLGSGRRRGRWYPS